MKMYDVAMLKVGRKPCYCKSEENRESLAKFFVAKFFA